MIYLLIKFFKPLFSAFLIACMLLLIKFMLTPAHPAVSWSRRKAAEFVADHLVDEIRKYRGDGKTAVVLHLDNDPTHCITSILRKRIEETGVLTVAPAPVMEKIMMHFGLPVDGCRNEETALCHAYNTPQDILIWGTVDRFETDGQGKAVLTGMLHIIDANKLTLVKSCPFSPQPIVQTQDQLNEETQSQLASNPQPTGGISNPPQNIPLLPRFAFLLALTVLPPLFGFSVIRDIVAKRSNNINMALLLVLSAFDTILATAILGIPLAMMPLSWFMTCVATFSVFCNLMLLSHAARLEA